MKILILLKKWPGGVGVVVMNIAKELKKRGHEVKIVSREEDLKINSLLSSVSKIRSEVRRLMKKNDYNIIYTQDWSLAFPLLFPFSIYKKRHFCCFHGNEMGKSEVLQGFVGKIMGKKLIVVGDSLKRRFPLSSLIYNGVDLDFFKPLRKKREYLGWINKDTEILSRNEIETLAKKLKLNPLIAQDIPPENMNQFYNKCKVFISLPPKSAGFNLCWIEAMAAGVPIIIGNNQGIGFKLNIEKIGTKEGLADKIQNSKEKDYRSEIEKSGLTWNAHVDKLIKIWGND